MTDTTIEAAILEHVDPTRLYTPPQVANILGNSERTIRRWIAAGTLPALGVGRVHKVRGGDLIKLLTGPADTTIEAAS